MKQFVLDIRAYHSLELVHHVCISESGHQVRLNNSRARYYISMDAKIKRWVFYRLSNEKNYFGEYSLIGKPIQCNVYAGFDQVSKYNR